MDLSGNSPDCSSAQLRQARTRRYESAADVGLVSFSLEERYEIMQWWGDHIDSLLNRSIKKSP
jgi:hypothetical protein